MHAQSAPRHWPRARRLMVLTLSGLVLATASGCQSETPPARTVTIVEVGPTGVLLTALGETKVLTASARSADGAVVLGVVTWSSSDAAIASVDTNGTVRATADVGTAMITAAVGDVRSLPTYVTVAKPVAGAVLLTDAQVVAGPTIVDATAAPASDAAYEVVVRGVTGAVPGAILIGAESRPVAGRVVSATPEGGDLRVRLVVVPPAELFTAVAFHDTIDLAAGPFEIPADLAAAYDVAQDGSSFVFTPKPAMSSAVSGPRAGNAALASWVQRGPEVPLSNGAPVGTVALPDLPPFTECEAEAGFGSELPIPLAISAPPSFTFNAAGTATREATAAGTKIVVEASPTFTFLTALEVKSAFEAKVGCKLTLVTGKFRVPGWAGLFFGGDISFGVGFELSGKVTLFAAKVGGTAELKPTFTATLNCPTGAECDLSGDATSVSKLTPVLEAPSLNQARFEPAVNLFAFLELDAGNADLEQLQFTAIEAKAGLELAASLTLEGIQIDNVGADGRSKYSLAFKGEVGPGFGLGEFLEYIGMATIVPLKLTFELALGDSPTGTVQADKARYLPGEPIALTVTLAPASVTFPSLFGFYNVNRVVIVRRDGLLTQVLAEQQATDGKTVFEFAFDSPSLIDAPELYAFVVTSLLPLDPPKLEIGSAAPGQGACPRFEVSLRSETQVSTEGVSVDGAYAFPGSAFVNLAGEGSGTATSESLWVFHSGGPETVEATIEVRARIQDFTSASQQAKPHTASVSLFGSEPFSMDVVGDRTALLPITLRDGETITLTGTVTGRAATDTGISAAIDFQFINLPSGAEVERLTCPDSPVAPQPTLDPGVDHPA